MITVHDGQSLFDLSIQECGGVEAVVAFATANGLSVTDALTAGDKMAVPGAVNQGLFNYYQLYQLKPATDATLSAMDALRDEGIDYWAVDVDFVIQ